MRLYGFESRHVHQFMTITERYNLIIESEKYSAGECHDISKWLCFIRDCEDEKEREKVETMLRAFINRKKLGIPVTTKKLEKEFGCV